MCQPREFQITNGPMHRWSDGLIENRSCYSKLMFQAILFCRLSITPWEMN